MNSLLQLLVVVLAVLLVGVPLVTFLHELGHAVAAAFAVGGRVTVVQGPAPARVSFSVWRFDLRLHGPVRPHQGMVGWAVWGPHPDARRHVVAMAAGPFVSGLCAGVSLLGAYELDGQRLLLGLLGGSSTLQTLSSGLPVRYGRWFGSFAGEASDGLRIRRLLRGTPEPGPPVAASAPGPGPRPPLREAPRPRGRERPRPAPSAPPLRGSPAGAPGAAEARAPAGSAARS